MIHVPENNVTLDALHEDIRQQRIELEVSNRAPSTGLAYVLWFFLGGFGIHRFYLGRTESGAAMAFLSITGWAWSFVVATGGDVVGSPLPASLMLLFVALWALFDVFRIPSFVRVKRSIIRHEVTKVIK